MIQPLTMKGTLTDKVDGIKELIFINGKRNGTALDLVYKLLTRQKCHRRQQKMKNFAQMNLDFWLNIA